MTQHLILFYEYSTRIFLFGVNIKVLCFFAKNAGLENNFYIDDYNLLCL